MLQNLDDLLVTEGTCEVFDLRARCNRRRSCASTTDFFAASIFLMAHIPIRREGFVGQHLVIVPPPVRQQALSHPLLSGLLVTDAGYFPAAAGHRAERPQGAATHIIIVCLHGRGWVRIEPKRIELSAGELVWIPADTPHAYGSAHDDPWTIVWVHFCGSTAGSWRSEINWAESDIDTFHFGSRAAPTLGLDEVYSTLERGYSFHHLLAARIALEHSLSSLLELSRISGAERSAGERTANVRKLIIASPARNYRLAELAESAGLSVPHFTNLFKKQCGFAPIDFVLRQRIRLGCKLLDTTTATIGSIAEQVGFKDPYYFSRCFTKIMGASPREYRNSVKG